MALNAVCKPIKAKANPKPSEAPQRSQASNTAKPSEAGQRGNEDEKSEANPRSTIKRNGAEPSEAS